MTYIEAIVLGIVQGLTEFLPVSSSGHLELGKALFGGAAMPEESLFFTVVVHFATALSTIIVFRREVWEILRGLLRFQRGPELDFSLKIIVSMVPAAFVGVVFSAEIEQLFDRQILLVGIMLLVTSGLLFVADRARDTHRDLNYRHAIVIGLAQAFAILPGISRSGATISTSVLLGIDRARAASFSFLMVVPLIFGKIILDLGSGSIDWGSAQVGVLATGFAAAFATGWVACAWMIRLVRRAQLRYFSIYCVAVGSIAIAVELIG